MSSDPTMTGRRPAAAGAQALRQGGMQNIAYDIWRTDFDPSTETNPPTPLNGARKLGFKQIQWVFVKPAGVTAYDVTFYRLAGVVRYKGDTPTVKVALTWIPDETVSFTEHASYLQSARGDELYPVITGVVGPIGTGFNILYKGCSE